MANIKDLASGIVATAPSPATSGLSITLQSGQGANMPIPPFYATATPPGNLSTSNTSEIVLVTDRPGAGDTFTIVRNQKTSGGAKSIAVGWIFTNGIYTDDLLSSSISFDGVFNETPNSSRTSFTTPLPFTSIMVLKNTTVLVKGNDYTTPSNNTVTFVTAPTTGTTLRFIAIMGNQVMNTGSNGPVFDETPGGLINGSNTTLTTARPYVPNTLSYYVNGYKQKRGVHFFETSPATGQFTVSDAPLGGTDPDDVMVDYWYQVSLAGNADTVDGYNAFPTPLANTLLPLDANARALWASMPTGTQRQIGYAVRDNVGTMEASYGPNVSNFIKDDGGTNNLTASFTNTETTVYVTVDVVVWGAQGYKNLRVALDGGTPASLPTSSPVSYLTDQVTSASVTFKITGVTPGGHVINAILFRPNEAGLISYRNANIKVFEVKS